MAPARPPYGLRFVFALILAVVSTTAVPTCTTLVEIKETDSTTRPLWETLCNNIPANAQMLEVTMGNTSVSVKDYYKPDSDQTTFCQMLDCNHRHRWSPDGTNWYTPSFFKRYLGGSSKFFPGRVTLGDKRRHTSFWGWSRPGGCCSSSQSIEAEETPGGGLKSQAFVMKHCIGVSNMQEGIFLDGTAQTARILTPTGRILAAPAPPPPPPPPPPAPPPPPPALPSQTSSSGGAVGVSSGGGAADVTSGEGATQPEAKSAQIYQ